LHSISYLPVKYDYVEFQKWWKIGPSVTKRGGSVSCNCRT